MLLRFDPERRFACGQCGRCCRRGQVALTPAEATRYAQADVQALWSGPGGPLERTGGFTTLRKRADGACGFLGDDDRCRIHAELGAAVKPLTCRMFPFSVHPLDGETVLLASASCPAVAAGEGPRLGDQAAELRRMARAWSEAFPDAPQPVRLHGRRRLDAASFRTLRETLEALLLRADGDLAANVGLAGQRLEDLTRHRVARLADDAFAEYLALTCRHAVTAPRTPLPPPQKAGARLVRSTLAAVLGTRHRFRDRQAGWASRAVHAVRTLGHLHGLAGGVDFDLRRAQSVDALADDTVRAMATAYLLSSVRTLGALGVPVAEELAVSVAVLHAALLLAADAAAREGRAAVAPADLRAALPDAADVLVTSKAVAARLAAGADPDVFRLLPAGRLA